jgi:pyruvate/2-oxoglutarate dehydrogenase complex dihydrolipoamide dehydrogenase (E3) component
MDEDADVVVLGMGPGGEDVAGRLAEAGLDVVGIDGGLVGGECPYWGCIPSKIMIRSADLLAEARRGPGLAGAVTVDPDWGIVARRVRDATDTWDDTAAIDRFEGKGGRFVRGWGRLAGESRVTVGERIFRARRAIVVNTGAKPSIPPVTGLEKTPYWTNRGAIETDVVPPRLAVLGGGAIGVELAQMFSRFGSEVTVLEAGPRLVGPEEPEVGALLTEVLGGEGIDVRTGVEVEEVTYDGSVFTMSVAGEPLVVAERLLVSTGRHPDLAALDLAAVGLDETARSLPVDDHLRVVGAPGIWAVGDITGHGQFTHISMYQADIVVDDILGRPVVPADYGALPRVTFTDPEVGAVGLTEKDARDRGLDVRTGSTDLATSARGFIHHDDNRGFIKLVEDAARGVLVGATSAGPTGGEMLGLLSVAVYAEVPTERLRHMIYAYPTFHRAIEAALRDLLGG